MEVLSWSAAFRLSAMTWRASEGWGDDCSGGAAEAAVAAGVAVDVYDAMGSVGRKFLLAGKGGLNLTHGEPLAAFVQRYGERQHAVASWLAAFDADALREWIEPPTSRS